jgi:UPF0271 protein
LCQLVSEQSARMHIDLNADLGEGDAFDEELLTIVSSCNVACGGHAGDTQSMRSTVAAAVANNVAVGAHPSYPDRDGFGRRANFLTGTALHQSLLVQIDCLAAVCSEVGTQMGHVKPHGALYNDAAADRELSDLIASTIRELDVDLALVGPPASALHKAAQSAGIPFVGEAFADRAYLNSGRLAPRSNAGAVHSDSAIIAAQAVSIVLDQRVAIAGKEPVRIVADTLCIHGDTPGAANIARAVRAALEENGVEIRVART